MYTYEYTFSTPTTNGKEISHFILELTKDITINYNGTILYDVWSDKNGNPLMPHSFYGVKFDELNVYIVSFSFTSTQAPVWGNFYSKDGTVKDNPVVAWNTGLGDPDNGVFIPRPDGIPVPEPGILLLLGIGMMGVGIASRSLRKI